MLQLAQVIKKKNSGLELFKMNDEERIKQFKIIFGIGDFIAENLNKAFNIYTADYFKMIKFTKFYLNPYIELNNALFILAELDPNHMFVVNQYPSVESVLVNFMVPVRLKIEPLKKGGEIWIRKASGQYYLRGAVIQCRNPLDNLFEVNIKYTVGEPNDFIDRYLDYIKNNTVTLKIYHRLQEIFNREPIKLEPFPIKLDYKMKIPKAMLNTQTVALVDLTNLIRVHTLDSELLLEYNELSDEILENEISREFNEHIFDRLSILTENGLYINLDQFDKYELTSKILNISEPLDMAVDRETIRDYALVAHLIYLNIHDNLLHINPNNSIVLSYTAEKPGQSLLDYYIDFMISLFKVLFHKNIKDGSKVIKHIYMNFVQITRRNLTSKLSRAVMVIPQNDSCGLYNKYIESCVGPLREKKEFAELYALNMKLINEAENPPKVQYYTWDSKVKLSRAYVSRLSSLKKYYSFNETYGNNSRILGTANHIPTTEAPTSEKSSLPDLITEFKTLRTKIGNYEGLDTFGLFVKKMQRDEKHNPKIFNKISYYKSAIQFLKTSIIELIYTKRLGNYAIHFKNINQIEGFVDPIQSSTKMRAYLFKLLETLPAGEIIMFLNDQKSLYDLYEILEYDVEYKKQKKLEQYEKRNNIFYNMTPEEKLLLGIDKLHGEERMNLLDRLVAEKEAQMMSISDE